MPNRIIRETILTSRAVNSLTAEEEVFYRRLMSIVDDWGRCEADEDMLLAQLYPLQLSRRTAADCGRLLSRVSSVRTTDGDPLVLVYTVDGRKYLQISHFNQRSRHRESKFPSPGEQSAAECGRVRQSAANGGEVRQIAAECSSLPRTAAVVRLDGDVFGDVDGDVFGDGAEGEVASGDASPRKNSKKREREKLTGWKREKFDEFWGQCVWAKIAVDAAAKAYDKAATTRDQADYINRQAKAQGPAILARGQLPGSVVLHPSTWLNQGRYDDVGANPEAQSEPYGGEEYDESRE